MCNTIVEAAVKRGDVRSLRRATTPLFEDYVGPEGLLFIKAEDNPNGKPLLVIGNEISG